MRRLISLARQQRSRAAHLSPPDGHCVRRQPAYRFLLKIKDQNLPTHKISEKNKERYGYRQARGGGDKRLGILLPVRSHFHALQHDFAEYSNHTDNSAKQTQQWRCRR